MATKKKIPKLTPAQRNALISFIDNREPIVSARDSIMDKLHDKQRELILEQSKNKIIVSGRRSGKTHVASRYGAVVCLGAPDKRVLYVARTRTDAKALLWQELKRMDSEERLGGKFSETDLLYTLPNGSSFWLKGADDEQAIEKLRGHKFHLVFIDEAGTFKDYLETLVNEILGPEVDEVKGTIVMIGNPNRRCSGFFYDKWHEKNSPWRKWLWTVHDNPFVEAWAGLDNWRELVDPFLDAACARKGWTRQSSAFRREWLGEWTRGEDEQIFRLPPSFPKYEYAGDEKYVLGIDLGFNDPSAWVVLSYSQRRGIVQEEFSLKQAKLAIGDVVDMTKKIAEQWCCCAIVIDPAAGGKNAGEELASRYGLNVIVAEKHDKKQYLAIMADEIWRRSVLVRQGEEVAEQLWRVVWDEDFEREEEGQECDLMDAMLYGWRYCYHFLRRSTERKIVPGSKEWLEKQENADFEKCLRKQEQEDETPNLCWY